MSCYDLIVIGAGPAGMMASILAAEGGASVLLLEKNPLAGKKLSATGNGRCNISNLRQDRDCYFSSNPAFVEAVFSRFGLAETKDFFASLGLLLYAKGNYLYPASKEAKSVTALLRSRLEELGVQIHFDSSCRGILKKRNLFEIPYLDLKTQKKGILHSKKVLLATGGLAAPATGSTGDGYYWAKQLGHRLVKQTPALMPLLSDSKRLAALAGLRIQAGISLFEDEVRIAQSQGEVQFTKESLSGIAIFQISRLAAYAFEEGRELVISLALMPWLDEKDARNQLHAILKAHPKRPLQNLLRALFPHRLVDALPLITGLSYEMPAEKLSSAALEERVNALFDLRFPIQGYASYREAQSTAGGLSLDDFHSSSMESRICPGFFAAGEVLDVDGICGGYNLQWAWSSAYLAAQGILKGEPHDSSQSGQDSHRAASD